MRIVLGNAPWNKQGHYGVRAGSRWPHFEKNDAGYLPFPFFLAYAAALLEKHGFQVLIIDAVAEHLSEDAFFARLAEFAPQLVVYEVSTPSIEIDLHLARATKNLVPPGTPLVFCGPHHEMFAEGFLQSHDCVDFVLKGEYEFTLLALARALESGAAPDAIPGLIARNAAGEVTVNPDRPLELDLGAFPWPARHLLPMEQYLDLPGGIPAPSLQIWASRGCPYGCIFCSWPQIMYGGSNYRTRDPKDVVDEIEFCVAKYGFKSFYFDDDTFNIGKPRILELCREIESRQLGLPWAIMARADCMDLEILTAMKRAGLVSLKYGVESSDPAVLAASGKALDLDRVRETIALTKKAGICFHLTFTFGLPGETRQTMDSTVAFALQADPDSLQFSIVTPFPGSRYFEMLEEKGYLLSRNWEEYDGYNRAVIRTDELSQQDLERALVRANRTWKRHVFIRNLRREPFKILTLVLGSPFKLLRMYYG
jgi:anaerobic magnesium-protoporphyrin IX monomethyl ester cyclase